MKRNLVQMLLAALLAVTLMVSAAPAATAAGTISENYDTVVSHIEANGSVDEETGWKFLEDYHESEGITIGVFLINSDDGLMFDLKLIGSENAPIISETTFLLKKTNNHISVEFMALLVLSEDNYDMVSSTKNIDRTNFTTSSTYTIRESGTYITSQMATELFNSCLQTLCGYWDSYLGETLGFGLRGLGFTSYEGFCSHNYGDWTEGENGHQQVCADCGDVQTEDHQWVLAPGSYDPTCEEDGYMVYSCTVCDAEYTETIPMGDAYHSFGNWTEVDEETHSHQCTACHATETAQHNWTSREVVQVPAEGVPGLVVFVCTDCGAEKTAEVEYIHGDFNFDGRINNKDVEYLLWHTLFPEDYPVTGDTDFNNDGDTNNLDVEYMLWYTLFPEDYPLQ